MLVRMSNEDVIDMLVERVSYWTQEDETHELYRRMYTNYVEGGCFEGAELDVMVIVDNDYVNYCDVVSEGDDGYEDIKALYEEQGLGDISCEKELNHGYNFIEAEYNDSFLLRW